MFRAAAAGPYDEAINKATDENLTSEDWGAIMEVCDRVASDSNGAKEAVQSMIKRLAHRNANVQLYTLEVANALSQNCGKDMHRELSSRAFTDAMLKLANDRNTHSQVKVKILERMKEWSDMFKSDPDLGIMYDAYYRLKQSNPTLQPPTAPQKNTLTQLDRQKEEEELQMALKLSLQEEERKKQYSQPSGSSGAAGPGGSGGGAAGSSQAAPIQPVPSGTTAATVSRVRALFDFVPSEPGELEFKKGDVIAVLESVYKDWWRGSLKGKTGIFPLNYVEKLTDPTPDELQREAQMEAEVFAEIKNVEKLLTLLSTNNTPREEDNEEISKLYHQTLAIRPKLIKLIEKYSQKKDDFTQLNEKFIKARRDYEALLESSMSHPPGPTYHQYAMRPAIPQGYPTPVPGGYGAPPPQQDPQRFYTPAPQEPSQQQYPPTSPSPNFQRPGPGGPPGGNPVPVYFAGAEIPSQPHPLPSQTPQQQPPQQHQQQQPQQQQHQPYAGRPQQDQQQRIPSGGGPGKHQPAPIQTSSSPPPHGGPSGQNQYSYNQGPQSGPMGAARPQSGGYGPQELSTSVYDSPIAQHHQNSAANYSGSVYSPVGGAPTDDPYGSAASPTTANAPAPPAPTMAPPGVPAPLSIGGNNNANSQQGQASQRPGYGQGYTSYHQQQNQQQSHTSPRPYGGGFDPDAQPGRQQAMSPPLGGQGGAYDSRQTLPSRLAGGGGGYNTAEGGAGGGGAPQYKAYVPPGSAPSAPPSGPPGVDDGPSAPSDYYRTAAY